MGNPIRSIVGGVGHVVGNIFGSPFDFLSGKSCSSLCGPTWDIECYIENFCIEHLLKFFAVSFLFYCVLLLLYIIYKLRVFHCIFKVIFKMFWGCFSTFFSAWEQSCIFMCNIMSIAKQRRRRRKRDIEMANMRNRIDQDIEDMETSVSYEREPYHHRNKRRFWSRDHKRNYLKKSLKPKNHGVRVGVDAGDSVYVTKRKHIKHGDVRVIRTSNHKKSKHLDKKKKKKS